MRGIRIGRLFGIDIAIHYSWFIILGFFAVTLATGFFPAAYRWPVAAYWIVALAATLLLFVSVVAHELGHSLIARWQGIPVRNITLFILGGVSSIEKEPTSPRREAVLAGVGPLVSLAIGVATFWLSRVLPGPQYVVAVLFYLGLANITLAVFNMLPGFPMDGGRVLRALLWWRSHDFVKATRRAATVSRVFGYLMIAFGVYELLAGAGFGSLWLAFIGWMLIQTSRVSVYQAQLEHGLEGVSAGRLVSEPPVWVPPFVTLSAAARDYFLEYHARCLPVEAERDGQVYDGALCIHDFDRVQRPEWGSTRARDAMTGADAIPTVDPGTPAYDALRLLAERRVSQVAVVDEGRLLGFVDQEGAASFLKRRQSLGESSLGERAA